jgi:hypothetical protein
MSAMTVDTEELLTLDEAGREIRKSGRTMRRMADRGDIATVTIGRQRYVRLEDLAGLVRIHPATVNGRLPDRPADQRTERMRS